MGLSENKASILVVDDMPANLRLLVQILSEHGYKARPVTNGMRAIEAIQAAPPDLVLLDINMPEMNGYEVCRRLKADANTRDIPVIFISALGQTEDKIKAFTSGGVDYITKPFQVEEVLARVQTHLMIYSLNRELEQRVEARTAELRQLNISLERFVPAEFLALLHKDSITDFKLGDQVEQEMTILFSDIRNFTALSEQMPPQENFNFLNSFLSRISPIIRQHNGFIDKYLGDGIMSIFQTCADDAIQAAVAMQQEVSGYNQHRLNSGYPSIQIGVGVHTGKLMLGIIGDGQRLQSTVISDAVNLTSRLEDATKLFGASIITSTDTMQRLEDPSRYVHRFLGLMQVKGRLEAVPIFEIFGAWDPAWEIKQQTAAAFNAALEYLYLHQYAEAQTHFEKIVQQNPDDQAAWLYLERCRRAIEYPGAPEAGDITVL